MKKLRFNQLPIYKAIRGSKLSRRKQDEVLRKLKNYYPDYAKPMDRHSVNFSGQTPLTATLNWGATKEGIDYWHQIHCDSGL